MTAAPGRRTVVGAVIIEHGRVLAARRIKPAALAGRWEFPGGKVEAGEDPATALARELVEELSLTAAIGVEVVGPSGAWAISATHQLRLFLATRTGDDLTIGTDHDQITWLAAAQLEAVEWLDADRQALDAVRAHLAS